MGQASQTPITDNFISTTIEGIISKLQNLSPEQRRNELMKLNAENPSKFNELMAQLNSGRQIEQNNNNQSIKPPRSVNKA